LRQSATKATGAAAGGHYPEEHLAHMDSEQRKTA